MLRSPTITLITTALALVLAVDSMADGDCFRGKPLPECQSFWIIETGAQYRFGLPETHQRWYETLMYSYELGLMFNRSTPHAIGGALFFDYDDYENNLQRHNIQVGIRPRYRRWLVRKLSLDIAPGLILTGSKIENPVFSGEVMVNISDLGALTFRLDMRNRRAIVYSGIKFCSYPGLVVGIAGPIIAAAIWAKHFNSGNGMQW